MTLGALPEPGEVIYETVGEDRVKVRWVDERRFSLHEAIYTLEELGKIERGESIPNPAPLRSYSLTEQRAMIEARSDQIRARMKDLEEGK